MPSSTSTKSHLLSEWLRDHLTCNAKDKRAEAWLDLFQTPPELLWTGVCGNGAPGEPSKHVTHSFEDVSWDGGKHRISVRTGGGGGLTKDQRHLVATMDLEYRKQRQRQQQMRVPPKRERQGQHEDDPNHELESIEQVLTMPESVDEEVDDSSIVFPGTQLSTIIEEDEQHAANMYRRASILSVDSVDEDASRCATPTSFQELHDASHRATPPIEEPFDCSTPPAELVVKYANHGLLPSDLQRKLLKHISDAETASTSSLSPNSRSLMDEDYDDDNDDDWNVERATFHWGEFKSDSAPFQRRTTYPGEV